MTEFLRVFRQMATSRIAVAVITAVGGILVIKIVMKILKTAFSKMDPALSKLLLGVVKPVMYLLLCLIVASTLGDLLWIDNNKDGLQNAGEVGLAGKTITVVVKAKRDYYGVLFSMTFPVVHATQVEVASPLGTGPYMVTAFSPGSYLWLAANPNWWQMEPQVKEIMSAGGGMAFEYSKVNGKQVCTVGVDVATSGRSVLNIRKDWLDKVGMTAPESFEDVVEIARAFTTQDPDGNGQNDTWGLALNKTMGENSGYGTAEGVLNAFGGSLLRQAWVADETGKISGLF